jgi:hypothetical protein
MAEVETYVDVAIMYAVLISLTLVAVLVFVARSASG